MSARRWRIAGDVQGVGFRAFAAREARSAGVRGGVRNEPDGSVTAAATGDDSALDRFAAALARGPRFGRVVSIEPEELFELPRSERFDLDF